MAASSSSAARPQARNLPNAEEILRRSIEAGRTLNLRGTETVIVQPPRTNMVSMTRRVIRSRDGVTLTRWTDPPSQRGLTILDDGTWSRCYQPADKMTKVSRSTRGVRDAQWEARLIRLILRNYSITLEGTAPMAGRNCYKLKLVPRHNIGLTVRMWIDRANGAVLSHMESNAHGETLSVSSFNGVEFPDRLDAGELRKSFPSNVKEVNFSRSPILRSFEEVRKRAGFEFCPPYAMPGGYEFQYAEVLSLKGLTTTCLRYSDGLSEITICQNRAKEQRPAEYQSTQPMVDAMGNNILDHQVGQMNFYLVGRCHMSGLIAITNALDVLKERVYLGYLVDHYRVSRQTLVALRNKGMGLDTMDALLAIRQQAQTPLESLVTLCRDGHGWTAIARRFRANVGRILKHVRTFECR
jgi:hypothetical protein